jgi:hypothetical protein
LRLIHSSAGQECAASGKQVTWDGARSAAITYTARDAVAHDGSTYIVVTVCKREHPAATTADWAILAMAGATGSTGQTGSQGPAARPVPGRDAQLVGRPL